MLKYVSGVALQNKRHHRILELKLHLIDNFVVDIDEIGNLTFYLTLT